MRHCPSTLRKVKSDSSLAASLASAALRNAASPREARGRIGREPGSMPRISAASIPAQMPRSAEQGGLEVRAQSLSQLSVVTGSDGGVDRDAC